MTFADTVRHLVRTGARIDPWDGPEAPGSSEAAASVQTGMLRDDIAHAPAPSAPSYKLDREDLLEFEQASEAETHEHEFEPGLADLEAAVGLVSDGMAIRVVLSGFQSWPGLLWRAYQLADTTGVLILPTVVRPGGKVDIVITRDTAANG